MLKQLFGAKALTALATPAIAHVGDHSAFALSEMAAHLLEWDHLLIAFAVVAAGLAASNFYRKRMILARRRRSS
jgi:hypothetical protein